MARGDRAPRWALILIVVAALTLPVLGWVAHNKAVKSEPSAAQVAKASAADAASISAARASDLAAANRPVMAFLGDSYGEGTGSTRPNGGLADTIAAQMGWRLRNFSQGGTGYVTTGPTGATTTAAFPDRVPTVVAAKPLVVIVAGGLNDTERNYPDQQVQDAVRKTLTGLQQGLPKARILVVGPWWGNSFPTPSAVAVDRDVQSVAQGLGLPYLSPLQGKWITGSNDGRVPGNRAQYIGPDGTHPSQAGHDYLAGKIVDWVRSLPG